LVSVDDGPFGVSHAGFIIIDWASNAFLLIRYIFLPMTAN
jgi:hypothetical protein